MSRTIKEGSYAPMLQGVSQQVAPERLPGQVQTQLNMLSDPQTGIRRRPVPLWYSRQRTVVTP